MVETMRQQREIGSAHANEGQRNHCHPLWKIYLSKLQNVFVQIAKWVLQIAKCIFTNCKMYLSKMESWDYDQLMPPKDNAIIVTHSEKGLRTFGCLRWTPHFTKLSTKQRKATAISDGTFWCLTYGSQWITLGQIPV